MFWGLLEAEGVVHVEDGNDMSSIFFVHVLNQMLDLQELADCDLNAIIGVLQVIIDEEQLLFLGVLAAEFHLQPNLIEWITWRTVLLLRFAQH